MKRQINKITKILFACFLVGGVLTACGDGVDEINVDPQEESATDQNDSRKEKPSSKVKQDNETN